MASGPLKIKCRRLTWLIMMITVCLVYVKENINPYLVKKRFIRPEVPPPCHETVGHLRGIVKDVEDVNSVLRSLNITNFLAYGSLWGVYRFQGPLPWDSDADIGIIGDANYHKDILIQALEKKGFEVRDDVWTSGAFKLKRKGESLRALDIFVFNNYFGTMKRPGVEPWIGFVHYNMYHSFPAWMVSTPMPTMKFGWINARVPRGGREILKHLYPFSWRQVFLPKACKGKKIGLDYLQKFISDNVNTRKPEGRE